MKQAIRVCILGQQYTVKTEADPEEVHRVADFVNARLSEVARGSKVVDTLNIAVLALMNLAGEHLRLRRDLANEARLECRLEEVLRRIDDACSCGDIEGSQGLPGAGDP